MLSGIRLIASAAASSARAGGCTPRLARGSAGQRNGNLIGFIRFLSGAHASRNLRVPRIRTRLAELRNTLQLGPLIKGIEVLITPPINFYNCFLDTQNNKMCYLTPQQPWSFGNIALNWIINPDAVEKEAVRFSNYVTERSNEVGTPIGTPEKYLDTTNQLVDGYNLAVLGSGIKLYLEEAPTFPGILAIATYLNGDPANSDKYYLQPQVGDNCIVAKTGDPQYVFRVVDPQPFPSIPID